MIIHFFFLQPEFYWDIKKVLYLTVLLSLSQKLRIYSVSSVEEYLIVARMRVILMLSTDNTLYLQ